MSSHLSVCTELGFHFQTSLNSQHWEMRKPLRVKTRLHPDLCKGVILRSHSQTFVNFLTLILSSVSLKQNLSEIWLQMIWRIIFACGSRVCPKGCWHWSGGTATINSSQYSPCQRSAEMMPRERVLTLQCILGQHGLSDRQENFISCSSAAISARKWLIVKHHIADTRMHAQYAHSSAWT